MGYECDWRHAGSISPSCGFQDSDYHITDQHSKLCEVPVEAVRRLLMCMSDFQREQVMVMARDMIAKEKSDEQDIL